LFADEFGIARPDEIFSRDARSLQLRPWLGFLFFQTMIP